MNYLVATLFGFWLLWGAGVHAQDPLNTNKTTEDKFMALRFDDGPDARITPALLDVLKRYTFFSSWGAASRPMP